MSSDHAAPPRGRPDPHAATAQFSYIAETISNGDVTGVAACAKAMAAAN